ncbi:hypothetical protein [Skermania piniformis]|uniref:hypothetical protein n=1 Tax=Skermania pinensis TaxID=39122 RepID=UPI00082CAF60|nr:hypothetical protein [Skermania piniformis]
MGVAAGVSLRTGAIEQVTPRDAELLWLSRRMPTDQFLLFGFDGPGPDRTALPAFVADRVAGVGDLRLRLAEVPGGLDYPYWVPRIAPAVDVLEHELAPPSWPTLLAMVGGLLASRVDPRSVPWRLHVFREVAGVPECVGPATVVVLQITHALADGRRASAIARALFGPPGAAARLPRAPSRPRMAARAAVRTPARQLATIALGVQALRAYRRFGEPAAAVDAPLSPLNRPTSDPAHIAATIVCPVAALRVPGCTVTTTVLAAVGPILQECWPAHSQWAAEVTVAARVPGPARNNFRNVGIDLRIDELDAGRRRQAIGSALRAAAQPPEHPLRRAQQRVRRVLPAPVLRREVAAYPLDQVPPTVTGNTVVSSVHRGPADLRLGAAPVRFTAGFPALSPVMGLTHGIYGLGDTVAVGLHARAGLVDLEWYADRLRATLLGAR